MDIFNIVPKKILLIGAILFTSIIFIMISEPFDKLEIKDNNIPKSYNPSYSNEIGSELVLTYVGSSTSVVQQIVTDHL